MFVLNLLLLLDLTICMQARLEGLWVKELPTTRRISSLPSLVLRSCTSLYLSSAFLLVFYVMVFTIDPNWIFCHSGISERCLSSPHDLPTFRLRQWHSPHALRWVRPTSARYSLNEGLQWVHHLVLGHLFWQWHYQAFKTFKTGEILPKSVI
jgi:hypothetical protein